METPIPDSLRGGGTEGPPRVPASQQPPPVAPPTQAGEIGGGPTPDATGGVIPYKNPAALIGYYVGIFSLIPGLGVPLALAALVLGVVGLRMRARKQAYGGQVHAWVAIVLGLVSLAYHTAAIVLIGMAS